MSKIDHKTRGAWLVHHTRKICRFESTSAFDKTLLAGKAGILLSGLSATEASELESEKVEAIAKAAGISTTMELPTLLDRLEKAQLVETAEHGVSVLGVSGRVVLEHTSKMFEATSPTAFESAAIELSEKTSDEPMDDRAAAEYLGDTFKLDAGLTSDLFHQCEQIGLVDHELLDRKKLYFNGNVFKRNSAKKVSAVLDSLSPEEAKLVRELDSRLRAQGCILLDLATKVLGQPLFAKLNSIGMYDISTVSNTSDECHFITRPSAFRKFGDPFADDALDLAKALVSSLTYGMKKRHSSDGRISFIFALLQKLVQGKWVGPATAIGEDYRVLELRRVVELRHDGRNLYSMRLLKRDVGELASSLLLEGDASTAAAEGLVGVSVTNYRNPETNREIRRKEQGSLSKQGARELLTALRTGKH